MNNDSYAEVKLLKLLKTGDADAYRQLYNKYHAALYVYILRFVKIPELAEDVLQDVFIKIWEIRERVDSTLSFQAYLYRISRNCVFKLIKKIAADERLRAELAAHMSIEAREADVQLQWQQYEQILQTAVNQLPPQRQNIFKLCRQEGKKYEEVAAELHISRNTVKEHMVLAVRSIKDYVYQHTDIHLIMAFLLLGGSISYYSGFSVFL
jgi:RNA polymerase sigma-70 factor (ECF subfamily)